MVKDAMEDSTTVLYHDIEPVAYVDGITREWLAPYISCDGPLFVLYVY